MNKDNLEKSKQDILKWYWKEIDVNCYSDEKEQQRRKLLVEKALQSGISLENSRCLDKELEFLKTLSPFDFIQEKDNKSKIKVEDRISSLEELQKISGGK